jgi:membrane-associated protease RseP (regulator of RpoE activity)
MPADDMTLLALRVRAPVEEVMSIRDAAISRRGVVFRGTFLLPPEQSIASLRGGLGALGFVPMVVRRGGEYEVRVVRDASPSRSNPLVNLLLLALTICSTLLVGAANSGVDLIAHPERFAAGIPFSASILSILIVHEFGHYLMAAFHGVDATLPYFIPAPTAIGTLGAVIRTKSFIPDRRSLLDIGAAGPICGFLVSLVALGVGLMRSEVADIRPLLAEGRMEYFGDSLAVRLMTLLVKGRLAEGHDVILGPVAFAGWVGLLVTAFNLMPVGQLDGGHIAYAVAGRLHAVIAKCTLAALFALGFVWWPWWMWVLLILTLGPGHAPPLDDVTPLDRGRKFVACAAAAILVLCFVPIPISARG